MPERLSGRCGRTGGDPSALGWPRRCAQRGGQQPHPGLGGLSICRLLLGEGDTGPSLSRYPGTHRPGRACRGSAPGAGLPCAVTAAPPRNSRGPGGRSAPERPLRGGRAADPGPAKMVRKLKYHEQKLLRRLDLVNWEASGGNLAEVRALRRYRVGRREDYVQYKALARDVRALARRLRDLGPASAAFRARCAAALLEKLHGLGLVNSRQSLAVCESLSAAAFCRRRLPCLLVKLRMAQNLRHAVTFVEQGHVRVGPEVVTDPALLVPRAVEDFITWVDASRLRQKVLDYNQERDDFDLAA